MSKKQLAAKTLVRLGGIPLLNAAWGARRLTVLAYHRIMDYTPQTFEDYLPVVSATPTDFEQQIGFIDNHFNVISLDDLRAALFHDKALPPHPLLITFDDGYLDNYENAYPVLKRFGFPAVIFLTTSRMDQPTTPLWWDAVARAFYHTEQTQVTLPLIGEADLSTDTRPHTLNALLSVLKKLSETKKNETVAAVIEQLGTPPPPTTPTFMNWDQVRELVNNGVQCQGHTLTHPIMTRIDTDEARRQLAEAKHIIQTQTNQSVNAFAYPNGTASDYSPATMQLLAETGYDLAFTLAPGPMRWAQVAAHPLQIRRVYLGYQDSFEIFQAKVMGLPAFKTKLAYPNA